MAPKTKTTRTATAPKTKTTRAATAATAAKPTRTATAATKRQSPARPRNRPRLLGKSNVLNAHLAQMALEAAWDAARVAGLRPQHTIRLKHGELPLLTMNQRNKSTSRVVSFPHIRGVNAVWAARQLTLVTEMDYGSSRRREFAMCPESSSHVVFKLPHVAKCDQIPTMRAALRITVDGVHYFTTPVYLSMENQVRRANRTWQLHPAALAAVLQVDLRFREDTELCFFFSSPPWTTTADDLRAACQIEIDSQQLESLAAAVRAATPQRPGRPGAAVPSVASANVASAARRAPDGATALDLSAYANDAGDGVAYYNNVSLPNAPSMESEDINLSFLLDSPIDDDDLTAETGLPIGHCPFGFQPEDAAASGYLLAGGPTGLDSGMSTLRYSSATLLSPLAINAFATATRTDATMSPPAEFSAPSSFFDEDCKFLDKLSSGVSIPAYTP